MLDFLTENNELLGKIWRENKMCHFMGDFNLDLMNSSHRRTTCRGVASHFFPLSAARDVKRKLVISCMQLLS